MSRGKSIMRTIDEILDKIKELKSIKKDSELAELLGVKQNTLSTWRIRKTIPYDVFYHFCDREGFLLNWLLTGENNRIAEKIPTYYNVSSDAEIMEINRLLAESPQDKALVLKLLKGKKDIKEALEGFDISKIKEQEG